MDKENIIKALTIRALSGWIRRKGDEMLAMESWARFKGARRASARKTGLVRILSYAAVACVVFIATSLWFKGNYTQKLFAVGQPSVISTPPGQRARLTLEDGTTVWLNANSSISYPAHFTSHKERRVKLEGEAYFEVAHDPSHPFVVTSPKASVSVLGTKFNMRDFSGGSSCCVSLLEGRVDVAFNDYNGSKIALNPRETVSLGNGSIHKSRCRDDDIIMWVKGIYVFDNLTFEEIATELGNYYGMDIRIENGRLAAQRFSGKFRYADGVENLLRTLQHIGRFKYSRNDEGNTIVIQ